MVDPQEIIVAKGGEIHFAPGGTPLPAATDPRTTLDAGFKDAGHVTEDGCSIAGAVDLLEILGWRAARPIRREVNRRDFTSAFALQQWNSDNLALAFGGGEVTETAPGVGSYNFPADEDALDEVSLVVDWEDLGYDWRLIWERGNVTEGIETSLIRTGASVLPITYSVLDGETLTNSAGDLVPGRIVSNHPGFTPVS